MSAFRSERHILSVSMFNDYELLCRYVREGSEEAFAELVTRHVGLVYSAALRQLWGNPHLAQDIAQVVFTRLASKAAEICETLRQSPDAPDDAEENENVRLTLAGWLHRDTRFKALTIGRKEHRRQTRQQEAFKMQSTEQETEPDWTQVRPWLDESLDQLRPLEREALLLRFFEQRSLVEVGLALGSGEEAARKRVNRALDRLREVLASRGVTTTAGALSLMLTARAAQTVPTGLAKSLARAALSGAGAAATTATGILPLLTSAKALVIFGTTAVALAVGWSALKSSKSRSTGNEGELSGSLTVTTISVNARDGNENPELRATSAAAPAARIQSSQDRAVADALEDIKRVLHDPKTVHVYPNPAMVAAIKALRDQKKAAVPILREALADKSGEVRERAADGLGIIGPEAREAAPDLMVLLRDSKNMGDGMMAADALRGMGPMPELLPEMGSIFKTNSFSRSGIENALAGLGRTGQGLAGVDSAGVDAVFRPMLKDTDLDVRCRAAAVLALFLKTNAGPEAVSAANEALRVGDDNNQRVIALTVLMNVAHDLPGSMHSLSREKLGAATAETIAALAEVVKTTKRSDVRAEVVEMLNSLDPSVRETDSNLGALLKEQEATDALCAKVNSGEASVADVTNGLARYPKAAPYIAEKLARKGTDGKAALPALRAALEKLAPPADASGPDRSRAFGDRQRVADSIQKIAPDEPKILFGKEDTLSIMQALEDPLIRSDVERRKRIGAAMRPVLSGAPGNGVELTPAQMSQLLPAIREADWEFYNAVLTRVLQIDPHFQEAAQSAAGSAAQ